MAHPKQIDADAILKTALHVLEEEGVGGLSLRGVAARLEVKAPSIYRYFADRACMERALIVEGQKSLLAWLRRYTVSADAEMAVRELAEAYLRFARRRPALYFFMTGAGAEGEDDSATGKELWNFVLAKVGALSGNADDTSGAVAMWSFLHGFAVLEHSGRFGKSGPKGGLERGLTSLILGSIRERGRILQ